MLKSELKFASVRCPRCGAPPNSACRTLASGSIAAEAHAQRHHLYYQTNPAEAPDWWHRRYPLPTIDSQEHSVIETPDQLQARIRDLEAENQKLRESVRLAALDRAQEHHRRNWPEDKVPDPKTVIATAAQFETYLAHKDSGSVIENFPADVCPECKTANYAHTADCHVGGAAR